MTTTQPVHMDITKGSQLPAEDVNGSEGKAAGTRKESVKVGKIWLLEDSRSPFLKFSAQIKISLKRPLQVTAVVPPEAAENSAPIPPIASRSDASSDASTSDQDAERKRQKKELVRRERERIVSSMGSFFMYVHNSMYSLRVQECNECRTRISMKINLVPNFSNE